MSTAAETDSPYADTLKKMGAPAGVDFVTKGIVAEEIHLTPGERSMVAWITCDNVDLEADVVVSSGVDFKHYLESNPVVLAIHDMGKWPIGQCQWIKLKKNGGFSGLVAKSDFDSDPDSEVIWGKVARKSVRSVSIGFIPPDDLKPGEWGPPTPEELRKRPDWAKARRIIRRCVLKEYSICPIGMNPAALIIATSKGFHKPNFTANPKAQTMTEETPLEAEATETEVETKAAKPATCECGKAECDKCSGMAEGSGETGGATVKPVVRKDDEEDDEEEKALDDEMDDEAADEEADPDEPEPDDDEDDESEEEGGGFKRGDHVKVKSPHFKGFGMVEGVHKSGLVPHADNDMMASKDDPAARVRAYKAMGDGHVPTEFKVAVKCAHMTRLGTPMKPPSKGKAAPQPTTKTVRTEPVIEPLPPLVAKSDQQLQKELAEQIQNIPALVKAAVERLVGVV